MKVLFLSFLLWFAAAADIAGKWTVVAKGAEGRDLKLTMELREADGKLAGQLTTNEGDVVPLADVKLEGDQLTFKVPTDQGNYTTQMTVTDKEMKGTSKTPEGAVLPVTAVKQ